MGLGESDPPEEDRGGDGGASVVACSICLEAVKKDNGDRSTARLQCGHEFHLDCIGSAFNAKGLMQCPNCRKIEKGQWLYANGHRSFPEFNLDDWPHDEDLYDLNYSELPFGVHWCPFSAISRLTSSFVDGELQSITYHDLLGHHSVFTQQPATSSDGHSCPYLAYFQPLQSSSSNPSDSVADGPTFVHHQHHRHHHHHHQHHHNQSSHSGPSDVPTSHAFPAVDLHYHSWEQHSPAFSIPNSDADQASASSGIMRPTRHDSDVLSRSGSFGHPILLSHGGHPRIHGFLSHHPQLSPPTVRAPVFSGTGRLNVSRSTASAGPTSLASGQSSFYVFPSPAPTNRSRQDTDNTAGNRFYAWERDRFAPYPLVPMDRESSWWSTFPQGARRSDTSSSNGYWFRHGSERLPSQSRVENPSHHMMHPFI